MATTATSLRERKKVETRELLSATALALFERHGFDAVTVDDIVEASGVSARTFFRYFGSKEAVLFADQDEVLDVMREAIVVRPMDEPPYVALREALLAVTDHYAAHREQHLRRARLAETGAAVATYQRSVLQPRWEQLLAETLAERLAVGIDRDVRPRLLAGIAIAVMTSVGAIWVASDGLAAPDDLLRDGFASLEAAVREVVGG